MKQNLNNSGRFNLDQNKLLYNLEESFEKISGILRNGTKEQKIDYLEKLSNTDNTEILEAIVSRLDDPDIEIRGEAFSSLVLNENKISKTIIKNLNSDSKNIRGFSTLVLANRNDLDSIPFIIQLTKDESAMVRSCALGALGYLKAKEASSVIHNCILDDNIEVKKSAIKAVIDIGDKVSSNEIENIPKNDEELVKLATIAIQKRF